MLNSTGLNVKSTKAQNPAPGRAGNRPDEPITGHRGALCHPECVYISAGGWMKTRHLCADVQRQPIEGNALLTGWLLPVEADHTCPVQAMPAAVAGHRPPAPQVASRVSPPLSKKPSCRAKSRHLWTADNPLYRIRMNTRRCISPVVASSRAPQLRPVPRNRPQVDPGLTTGNHPDCVLPRSVGALSPAGCVTR